MSSHEYSVSADKKTAITSPVLRLAKVIATAARFNGYVYGLGSGERAALARLDPDGEFRPHQISALARAFIQADLNPEQWNPSTWKRWALIAHGMALAGHAQGSLGDQLCHAGISESRVTKLLTARGDAFRQLLPRLLRLLASQETSPNWLELGGLILNEGQNEEIAEQIRMRIAGRFFSAKARTDH